MMKRLALFTMVAVLAWAVEARAEEVKLLVSGVHCNGCAGKITTALNQVPGATVKGKIARPKEGETSTVSVTIDPSKGDVGDVAKAAANAETPHRTKGAPSVTLVLAASSLSDDNAKTLE